MFRFTFRRSLVLVLALLGAVTAVAAPAAQAGGTGPRPDDAVFEAAYINCVDDEVDEAGIDGDALVRVRVTNSGPADFEVLSGGWRVVVDGSEVASGEFITPAEVVMGATWEQVVRIPGGTGPAQFSATVELAFIDDPVSATFALDPLLEVPGDCPQPEETTTTTVATDPTVEPSDIVVVTPTFTG